MSSRRRGLTPTPASSSPQTNKRRSPTPTPTSSLPKSPRTGRASAGLMNSSFGFALDTAHQGGSLYSDGQLCERCATLGVECATRAFLPDGEGAWRHPGCESCKKSMMSCSRAGKTFHEFSISALALGQSEATNSAATVLQAIIEAGDGSNGTATSEQIVEELTGTLLSDKGKHDTDKGAAAGQHRPKKARITKDGGEDAGEAVVSISAGDVAGASKTVVETTTTAIDAPQSKHSVMTSFFPSTNLVSPLSQLPLISTPPRSITPAPTPAFGSAMLSHGPLRILTPHPTPTRTTETKVETKTIEVGPVDLAPIHPFLRILDLKAVTAEIQVVDQKLQALSVQATALTARRAELIARAEELSAEAHAMQEQISTETGSVMAEYRAVAQTVMELVPRVSTVHVAHRTTSLQTSVASQSMPSLMPSHSNSLQ